MKVHQAEMREGATCWLAIPRAAVVIKTPTQNEMLMFTLQSISEQVLTKFNGQFFLVTIVCPRRNQALVSAIKLGKALLLTHDTCSRIPTWISGCTEEPWWCYRLQTGTVPQFDIRHYN